MDANIWSQIDLQDPAVQMALAEKGARGLASDKISPMEAAKNLQDYLKMRRGARPSSVGMTPPESYSAVDESEIPKEPAPQASSADLKMTTSNPVSSTDMQAVLSNAAASIPTDEKGNPVKGLKAEQSKQENNQFKRSSNRFFSKSQDQLRAERLMGQDIYPEITGYQQAVDSSGLPIFVDSFGRPVKEGAPGARPLEDRDAPNYNFKNLTTDENGPVQKQLQGIGRMQDLLGLEAGANAQRSTMDFKPLAALADAWSRNPSHLAESISAPEDKTGKILSYADEIQKRLADIQKSAAENQKNMRGGSAMDTLIQASLAKQMGAVDTGKEGMLNPQRKLDEMRYRQLMTLSEKPQIQRALAAAQATRTELNLTNSKIIGPVSKEQFEELQNVVRRLPTALVAAGGGQTTGLERDAMTMRSAVKDLGKAWDTYVKNGVNEIPANDPQLVHFRKLAQHMTSRFQKFYEGKLNSLSGGAKLMLERNPDLKSDWEGYLLGNLELSNDREVDKATDNMPDLPEQPKKSGGTKKAYDPSQPVGPSATDSQKEARKQYLLNKARGG